MSPGKDKQSHRIRQKPQYTWKSVSLLWNLIMIAFWNDWSLRMTWLSITMFSRLKLHDLQTNATLSRFPIFKVVVRLYSSKKDVGTCYAKVKQTAFDFLFLQFASLFFFSYFYLLRNACSPQVSLISGMSMASANWCGPLQPLEI